jgi:hypothetical protein
MSLTLFGISIEEVVSLIIVLGGIITVWLKLKSFNDHYDSIIIRLNQIQLEQDRQSLLLLIINNPDQSKLIIQRYDSYKYKNGNSYLDLVYTRWFHEYCDGKKLLKV